jgi:hypothetical protein
LIEHRPDSETGNDASTSVHIGFPVGCKYVGGNADLGRHGHSFRIEGDRLGHGELRLVRSIPLTDVETVTISQRGTAEPAGNGPLLAVGGGGPYGLGGVGIQHSKAKITTDLTVKTVDGQVAHWIIEQRGGAWVQAKLADVLRKRGIPLG